MIGINTAIFTQTGTSAGVGFAIPSSTVLNIVPPLIQLGKVGVGLNLEIAPDVVANQLNVRNGVLVLQVAGNSLAAKAGLLPTTRGFTDNIVLGDVIVAIDGKPVRVSLPCTQDSPNHETQQFLDEQVRNKGELFKVLDDYNIGDQLKIQRGSEILEVPLVLEVTSF